MLTDIVTEKAGQVRLILKNQSYILYFV